MGLPWGGCDLSGQLPRQQGGVEEQGLGRAQRQEVGHCAVTVCLGLPLCSPDVGGEAAVAPLHSTGSRDRKGPPCKENRLATAAQARITQAPGEQESDPQPRPPAALTPPASGLSLCPECPPFPSTSSLKERGPRRAFQLSLTLPSLGEEQGPRPVGPTCPSLPLHSPVSAATGPCGSGALCGWTGEDA